LSDPHHVVVMMGGPGAEREVSLSSGASVASALRSTGHAVTEIDPSDRTFKLPVDTHVVFLALHGDYGEDGTVQGQLEALGVPYTGCGVETSRIAFDKVLSKERFSAAGVGTPAYAVVDRPDAAWPEPVRVPAVLKPARQGSSVGLQFIDNVDAWPSALAECLRHDDRALLEERISGRECTVGIMEGRPLPVVEVRPRSGVYDFESKYTSGATDYVCPADLADDVTTAVQEAGLAAFEAVGGGDYCRVDVMVGSRGEPFVLEVNTLPGMTPTSLLPKAAAAAGMDYPSLCERMVELALRRAPSAVADRSVAGDR
jgi:D-alanine-D-alanine ligase